MTEMFAEAKRKEAVSDYLQIADDPTVFPTDRQGLDMSMNLDGMFAGLDKSRKVNVRFALRTR